MAGRCCADTRAGGQITPINRTPITGTRLAFVMGASFGHSFAAEAAGFEVLVPAAARITAATSFGRDSMATWLVGSDVTLALIFFAIARSTSGWIIRSFSATYQDGFVFHAAFATFSSKDLPKMGPCVTAITFVCAAGKSDARS